MNEKLCISIKMSLNFVLKGPIDNETNFGLDNDLTPNKRQAIIGNNADRFNDAYMRH